MTKVTLDFNDAATGTVIDDEYADLGVTISSIHGGVTNGSKSPAMIFDSANPTGGDPDLGTSNLGKVLIISEDGDSSDPDDENGGGTLSFAFTEEVDFHSVTLLDVEEGAQVKLYDADGEKIGWKYVTTYDNGQCVVDFGDVEGVARMDVEMNGSGAVDNVVYTTTYSPDPEGDGIVEGTGGDDLIDTAYTGDPEGDMIDNNDAIIGNPGSNDDIVVAGDGDDTIKAGEGDDEVYGNAGSDTIEGGAGNDFLIGDDSGSYGPGEVAESSKQEVFKWSELDDRHGGHLSNGEKITSQSQDTGENSVKLTLDKDYSNTFATDQQKVHSIDTGDLPGANAHSSLESDLGWKGDSETYTLEFEKDAENISFRVNDIDHDSKVVIKAWDADDNEIAVDMSAGKYVTLKDWDDADGKETAISEGGNGHDTSPEYSALVSIPGPAAKITITHTQYGYSSSQVNVTDIYFDTVTQGDMPGAPGNDVISGGAGDDYIEGNEGDDTLDGGTGNDTILGGDGNDTVHGGDGDDYLDGGIDDDTIYGGTGNDTIMGGEGVDKLHGDDDRDTFLGGNAGDHVDGGDGGDDYDTLDLTGSDVDYIEYTSPDREDGIVHFNEGGTMTFEEIENVIPCFTPGTLIATPRGEVPVEELKVGDKVITRDNGIQAIRWLGRTELNAATLAVRPQMKPIRIAEGALGGGLPERDMLVSPQHRVLVANDRTALYFEEREVLVAAKHLVDGAGITEASDVTGVSYIHFMFDQHEVVLSDGAWTESFQPGDYTLGGLDSEQRAEILELFPELTEKAGREGYAAARKTLKRHEALLLTA